MKAPLVGIVMGSQSDWDVMKHAAQQLKNFGVAFEARALSAHRSPDLLIEWIDERVAAGAKSFIAGAGGAAHLAGVVAAKTMLPVLAVPMPSKYLQGLDSLLSMVQMPKGIPVATLAIGEAGAANAGHFAVAMLALGAFGVFAPTNSAGGFLFRFLSLRFDIKFRSFGRLGSLRMTCIVCYLVIPSQRNIASPTKTKARAKTASISGCLIGMRLPQS